VKGIINFVSFISKGNYNIEWHDLNEIGHDESHKNLPAALLFMKEHCSRNDLKKRGVCAIVRDFENLRRSHTNLIA
jgi:hypothetical protein